MSVQNQLHQIFNEVLGQSARVRKGGWQLTYHCPFCADKNLATQKLEVAVAGPATGNYHCWRCNARGKSFGSLLRKLNSPTKYRDAIFKLTGDIKLLRSKKKKYHDLEIPAEFIPIYTPQKGPEYKNALNYLIRRGITKEDIIRYNIGYCEEGSYAYHIIIPSYDSNGILNFFIGRRYYTTDGVCPHKKPDVSMNIVGFESFLNYNEPVNLCEGVFDALTIRNNAVPLFGKYPSKKLQENLIHNKTKRVNIILDNDAMKDAIRNCELMIKLGIEVALVKLDGKDPSVIGFEKIHELIRQAKPIEFRELLAYRLKL